jgi:hypothetical protein
MKGHAGHVVRTAVVPFVTGQRAQTLPIALNNYVREYAELT